MYIVQPNWVLCFLYQNLVPYFKMPYFVSITAFNCSFEIITVFQFINHWLSQYGERNLIEFHTTNCDKVQDSQIKNMQKIYIKFLPTFSELSSFLLYKDFFIHIFLSIFLSEILVKGTSIIDVHGFRCFSTYLTYNFYLVTSNFWDSF